MRLVYLSVDLDVPSEESDLSPHVHSLVNLAKVSEHHLTLDGDLFPVNRLDLKLLSLLVAVVSGGHKDPVSCSPVRSIILKLKDALKDFL